MRKFGSTADVSSQQGRLISRRDVLALTGAAGCALGSPLLALPAVAKPSAPRVSAPPYDELTYDIRFAGVPIGEQRLRFEPKGARLAIASSTRIKVGIGILSAYEYRQESRETWYDGRLVAVQAVTEDDGARTTLRGEAVEDGFSIVVQGGIVAGGRAVYPAELATNNNAWTKDFLGWSRVLDLRDGELLEQRVGERRAERIKIGGKARAVEHVAVKGRKIAAALWYLDDLLLKAHVSRAGQTVEYRRRSLAPMEGLFAEETPRLAQQPGNRR